MTCRGCESTELEQFLDLGEMALAGGFLPGTEAISSEKKYPLSTYVCRACGLVQILDVVDPMILFQDYSFSSSTVGPLVEHFHNYAQWLQEKFKPQLVVEFGCNDGVLLTPLGALDIQSCGVDISENITGIARAKGLDVLTGCFDKAMAEQIVDRVGQADVVTGSNAFAHNAHPEVILEAARKVLKPKGRLCLEFMYAGDLLEMIQWDTLYHEHLTFYSLSSLQVLLKRFGFHVVDAERWPMHGGSLRVTAALDVGEEQPGVTDILEYEKSKALDNPDTWIHFGQHVDRKIAVVRETLERLSHNSRIWGYGAAGKATLWVNACKMDYLEAMVDASPLRAGKLMPGTHTPIVFPEKLQVDPPEYVFVSAWNYADLIRSKESWFQGIWLVPLPDLRFF